MKKLFLIFIFNIHHISGFGQDTLTVKSLFLSPIDYLYERSDGSSRIGSIPARHFALFTSYFVKTGSFQDYNRDISDAIYITNYSPLSIPFDKVSIKQQPTKIPTSLDNPDVNYWLEYPTKSLWKKVNDGNIYFFAVECEFKCIPYKQVELKVPNLEAKRKKYAFKTITPMIYYITEVVSMKPVKL